MMKKAALGFILFILIAVTYLFWTDFGLFRKFIGYNVPQQTSLPTISPGNFSLPFLKIQEGFKIDIFAKGLNKPRVIAFGPKGEMLVSETENGRVLVFQNNDKDGVSDSKKVLIDGLNHPHGLAFYKKSDKDPTYLYIALSNEVRRYYYDSNKFEITDKNGQNIANLPDDGRHFTRTIEFGSNFRTKQIVGGKVGNDTVSGTKLYVSVGSSCDVCEEDTWKRAAILESDPDGNFTAEFAGGLRNAVFFTFHPKTKEIWATEMGRDDLGDNLPPDEINIIKVAGDENKFGARRYGWPFCYGKKVEDKTFKPDKFERIDIPQNCSDTEAPIIEIPAHSAPLGLAFIPSGKGWPKEWEGDLLVALHGSWNRSVPVGYKIVRYDLDSNGKVLSQEPIDFISGWLALSKSNKFKDEIFGRPVDLKFKNGILYISDDSAGMIYKVSPIKSL